MVQASDPRTLNSTKFGQYVRTSDLQMSDGYKCRTGTNVGLLQTSDQYKCRRVNLLGKTLDFG